MEEINKKGYLNLRTDESIPIADLEHSQPQSALQIKIKQINGEETQVDVTPDMKTVQDLKRKAFPNETQQSDINIKLIYAGKLLKDNQEIEQLNFKKNPFVHASLVKVEQSEEDA